MIEVADGQGGYNVIQVPIQDEGQLVASMSSARDALLQFQRARWDTMIARMVCVIPIDGLVPLADGRLLLKEQDALGGEEDREETGEAYRDDVDDDDDDGGNFAYLTDEEGQRVQDENGEWVGLDEYLNRDPYSYLESENEDMNENVGDDEEEGH